jgi:hypothetical protein
MGTPNQFERNSFLDDGNTIVEQATDSRPTPTKLLTAYQFESNGASDDSGEVVQHPNDPLQTAGIRATLEFHSHTLSESIGENIMQAGEPGPQEPELNNGAQFVINTNSSQGECAGVLEECDSSRPGGALYESSTAPQRVVARVNEAAHQGAGEAEHVSQVHNSTTDTEVGKPTSLATFRPETLCTQVAESTSKGTTQLSPSGQISQGRSPEAHEARIQQMLNSFRRLSWAFNIPRSRGIGIPMFPQWV